MLSWLSLALVCIITREH